MQTHTSRLSLALLPFLFGACAIGDEPVTDSPYESAFFSESTSAHVADGHTPVSLVVYGNPGATVTVEVTNATMIGTTSAGPSDRLTLVLLDEDEAGLGYAELQIVSATPGLARVSFALAPLAASTIVEFVPVEFFVEPAIPVGLLPGEVVHELCIFTNTARGSIRVSAQGGSVTPALVDLHEPDGAPCESHVVQHSGAALLQWTGAQSLGTLDLQYLGPDGEVIAQAQSQVEAQPFPGYHATLQEVETTSQWARLSTLLTYRSSGALNEDVAAFVPLDNLRSVPEGLMLVGSSSGSVPAPPETDENGAITLYFEVPGGTAHWSIFATPKGGGTLYLGEFAPFSAP
jgi:hypothetical protein